MPRLWERPHKRDVRDAPAPRRRVPNVNVTPIVSDAPDGVIRRPHRKDHPGDSGHGRKHKKHAGPPSTSHRVQSRFDSSCTNYYQEAVQETIDLGFVYTDDDRGQSVVYCPSTGSSIGTKHYYGKYADDADTVVVVNTSDPNKMHAFVEKSEYYRGCWVR